MTGATPHDPRPRELPSFDTWWDGTAWRRTDEPSEIPEFSPRPPLAYTPPSPVVPPRRSRVDQSLRLIIGVSALVLGWSLLSGATPYSSKVSPRDFVDIPVVEPAGAAGAMPIDQAEDYAATYEARTDANGSYVASGQDVARAFGAELIWSDWDRPDPTGPCRHDPQEDTAALAWYCGAEPYLIHLNRTASTMPFVLYDSQFMDTVRHELAHLVIHRRCGNTTPAEGTVELEGVTSSYAVLYLGADRNELANATSAYPAYAMTTETDTAANWIHVGVCW